MKKWEYRSIYDNLVWVNDAGKEGWELVGIDNQKDRGVTFYLKREIINGKNNK